VTGGEEEIMGEPVIAMRRVRAELGSRPVLRGIDLTVHRGEVVALLGANGSGKSTAVRSVIGQVPVSAGTVELFGTPRRSFRDWARVGYVPQRTTAAGGVPATVTEIVSSGRLSAGPTGRPCAGPCSWSAWRTAPGTR
jgi:zinc transport system ATP-binding protein